jgi:Sugar-tranasporters, 12 TM
VLFTGIISNITAETLGFGPVAPFVVALAPLALCGVLVVKTWDENYGNRDSRLHFSTMRNITNSLATGIAMQDKRLRVLAS